jgi:hypothetical protein
MPGYIRGRLEHSSARELTEDLHSAGLQHFFQFVSYFDNALFALVMQGVV